MLIEKDVWDLVLTQPRFVCENPEIWVKDVKED